MQQGTSASAFASAIRSKIIVGFEPREKDDRNLPIRYPTLRLAVVLWGQDGDGELGIWQQIFWKVVCPRRRVGDDLGFKREQNDLRHQS
jgi:hypothetical protein